VIYLTALRPVQWIKNGFVLAPLLFSHQYNQWGKCLAAGRVFVSFCLLASAIYIINDLCDRREDRQHPVKKYRPIASGAIRPGAALLYSFILIVTGFAVSWSGGGLVILILLIFTAMNIIYSLGLKHLVILDVMTIAAGFVLRILGGSTAISVAPSHWLVLCTIMISLFLGFTKRRAELVATEVSKGPSRMVLQDYSVAFLDQMIAVVTGATIICYALYTVDNRTIEVFGSRAMLLTVPSVIYGMFRYLYVTYYLHQAEDPTRAVMSDIPTVVNLVIWIVICVMVVNYGRELNPFR